MESAIEYVDYIVGLIGCEKKVRAIVAADRKSREERAGSAGGENSIRWVYTRVPAADASVLAIENEKRGTRIASF
jgi:hypothetical protein